MELIVNVTESHTIPQMVDGEQVGFVQFDIHDHKNGHLDDRITPALIFEIKPDRDIVMIEGLNVVPELRKNGIGRRLINCVIEQYPDNVICLHAVPDTVDEGGNLISFEDSIKDLRGLRVFYEKCGFKSLDKRLEWTDDDGVSSFIYTGNKVGQDAYYKLMSTVRMNAF